MNGRTGRRYFGMAGLAGCIGWVVQVAVALPGMAQVPGQTKVAVDLTGSAEARAAEELLARPVTLDLRGVSRKRAIDAVAATAKVIVQYQSQMLEAYTEPVTVHAKSTPLHVVLEQVLSGTPFRVVPDGTTQLAIVRGSAATDTVQSTGTIVGLVLDSATGRPLAKAMVTVRGRSENVRTTDAGRFTIPDVPAGEWAVNVKLLGYQSATVRVVVTAGQTASLRVMLSTAPTVLSNVVTTATGVQQRLQVGNEITSINVDEVRRNAPVNTITDVLEGRVPGLTVQRASGAPGAPSRIRIRGISSVSGNNDPIIVVDQARVYSTQTANARDAQFSVLDNIDVNSIERIDVLKGPSASALYGSDAANGVIVITTKKGRSGPTRWMFSTDQSFTTQPRRFPDNAILEGVESIGGLPARCVVGISVCSQTRVVTYNPLSDDRYTVLGTGHEQIYHGSVSGGGSAIQFFMSGEAAKEIGLLKMSDADAEYIRTTTGSSVPGWQRRPQSSDRVGGTSRITMQVTPTLSADFTTMLDRTQRTSTPLSGAIGAFESNALPEDTSFVRGKITNFRSRQSWKATSVQNTLGGTWNAHPRLVLTGNASVQNVTREQDDILRRGDCSGSGCNNAGQLNSSRDTRSVTSGTMQGSLNLPRWLGVRLTPNVGVNYVRTSLHDTQIDAVGLGLGATSVAGADRVTVSDTGSIPVQLGYYVNSQISLFDQLTTSVGFRTDASNSLGTHVTPTYPKLDLSYVIPTERFVSPKTLGLLRLRLAYGHSAVQPELGEAVRTYIARQGVFDDGTVGSVLGLSTLGNPSLKPERSVELEWGFDTRVWNDRLTVTVTGFHKESRDALISVPRPLSLGGGFLRTNLGSVRNTGSNATVEATLIDRGGVMWNVNGSYSRTRNRLVSLAPTFDRSYQRSIQQIWGTRTVEGYPIGGTWMRPVVAYGDANNDGIITESEIIRSDSSAFVGSPYPKYETTFASTLGLWHGRLTLAANTTYQNGATQVNSGLLTNLTNGTVAIPALADPSAPVAQQLVYRSGYAALHSISTFRLQSVSVRMTLPDALARRFFRATAASLALQGSNLGKWSNYSGADPDVTDTIVGNALTDSGVLPQPRSWGLNMTLNF